MKSNRNATKVGGRRRQNSTVVKKKNKLQDPMPFREFQPSHRNEGKGVPGGQARKSL